MLFTQNEHHNSPQCPSTIRTLEITVSIELCCMILLLTHLGEVSSEGVHPDFCRAMKTSLGCDYLSGPRFNLGETVRIWTISDPATSCLAC